MSELAWYYGKDDKAVGPVPESKLRELMTAGTVTGEMLVWSEDLKNWTPLSKVEQLLHPPVAIEGKSPSSSEPRLKRRMPTVPPLLPPSAQGTTQPTTPAEEKPPASIMDTKPKKIGLKKPATPDVSAPPSDISSFPATLPPSPGSTFTPQPPGPTLPPPSPRPRRQDLASDRPGWITTICVLGFIGNGCGLIVFGLFSAAFQQALKSQLGDAAEQSWKLISFVIFVSIAISFVQLVGLWKMRRWSVYLYCAVYVLNVGFLMMLGAPMITLTNVIGLAISLALLSALPDMV